MGYKKEQVIYVIINIVTEKEYIGSTTDFRRRKRHHLNNLKNGNHHSNYLQNAYNKYGKESFEFKIIEIVDDVNLLVEVEQKWLDNETPEYNMTLIAGVKTMLGVKRSEETKKKISEALTGKKLSDDHKKKIGDSKRGLKQSEKTKDKRSGTLKKFWKGVSVEDKEIRNKKIKKSRLINGGYIVTDEMKKQISETLKSKNLQSAVSISIEKYDLNGELLETYPSMMKAEIDNGYGRSSLYYNLIKKGKKEYKGFIWKINKI